MRFSTQGRKEKQLDLQLQRFNEGTLRWEVFCNYVAEEVKDVDLFLDILSGLVHKQREEELCQAFIKGNPSLESLDVGQILLAIKCDQYIPKILAFWMQQTPKNTSENNSSNSEEKHNDCSLEDIQKLIQRLKRNLDVVHELICVWLSHTQNELSGQNLAALLQTNIPVEHAYEQFDESQKQSILLVFFKNPNTKILPKKLCDFLLEVHLPLNKDILTFCCDQYQKDALWQKEIDSIRSTTTWLFRKDGFPELMKVILNTITHATNVSEFKKFLNKFNSLNIAKKSEIQTYLKELQKTQEISLDEFKQLLVLLPKDKDLIKEIILEFYNSYSLKDLNLLLNDLLKERQDIEHIINVIINKEKTLSFKDIQEMMKSFGQSYGQYILSVYMEKEKSLNFTDFASLFNNLSFVSSFSDNDIDIKYSIILSFLQFKNQAEYNFSASDLSVLASILKKSFIDTYSSKYEKIFPISSNLTLEQQLILLKPLNSLDLIQAIPIDANYQELFISLFSEFIKSSDKTDNHTHEKILQLLNKWLISKDLFNNSDKIVQLCNDYAVKYYSQILKSIIPFFKDPFVADNITENGLQKLSLLFNNINLDKLSLAGCLMFGIKYDILNLVFPISSKLTLEQQLILLKPLKFLNLIQAIPIDANYQELFISLFSEFIKSPDKIDDPTHEEILRLLNKWIVSKDLFNNSDKIVQVCNDYAVKYFNQSLKHITSVLQEYLLKNSVNPDTLVKIQNDFKNFNVDINNLSLPAFLMFCQEQDTQCLVLSDYLTKDIKRDIINKLHQLLIYSNSSKFEFIQQHFPSIIKEEFKPLSVLKSFFKNEDTNCSTLKQVVVKELSNCLGFQDPKITELCKLLKKQKQPVFHYPTFLLKYQSEILRTLDIPNKVNKIQIINALNTKSNDEQLAILKHLTQTYLALKISDEEKKIAETFLNSFSSSIPKAPEPAASNQAASNQGASKPEELTAEELRKLRLKCY